MAWSVVRGRKPSHSTVSTGRDGRRGLIALLGAVVFLDAMLFGALAPLIPHFATEFDLSKRGAGLRVAALGAGLLAGGLPAGIAATRIGAKRTLVLGLVLLSGASLAFALSSGPWQLGLSRLGQGVASAMTWVGALAWVAAVAPNERRGGVIGSVFGAAVFGAIVGPCSELWRPRLASDPRSRLSVWLHCCWRRAHWCWMLHASRTGSEGRSHEPSVTPSS